jgi:outer membrane protein insertion porin family
MTPMRVIDSAIKFWHVTSKTICSGLLLAFLGLSVPLFSAQTRKPSSKELPPSAFKLVSINVTGSKRYTPAEIIAASGLRLGETVNEADFKVTSQHLGDTGAFSDIVYSFQYSPEGTKLDLQLTDSEQFVPARFDNFVWLSDEQLLEQLRERVPLFQGQLPVAGNLADQVSDALQALLIESKINGRADYLRAARQDGPIEAVDFSVSGVSIRVRNVEFSGAGPNELPLLQAAAKPMQGGDYLRSILRVQEDKNLLPVYLARGYLKASFADARAKVVQQSPQETLVDVSFAVAPGLQYKLTEVRWSGNSVFPAAQLERLIHLQAGQPANAVQLDADLEVAHQLYGTRGYLVASVKPTAQMDDAQSTVSYQLLVHEGDIYKMGELEIQGLDERNTTHVEGAWQLRRGEPYDSSYPKRFVDELQKELSLMGEWNISIHEAPNEEDKTVDVTVRLDPKLSR